MSFREILLVFLILSVSRSQSRLDDSDVAALKEIRKTLHDMEGSKFFKSWDFSADPCTSFSGVICKESADGALRIEVLNLGSGHASFPGLSGKLSPAMGSLTALVQLILYPGKIRGEIPDTLGSLHELEVLAMSKNSLSGRIPSTLQNLQKLHALDLSYNKLQGAIPAGLAIQPYLKILVLAHNDLVGTIPSIGSQLVYLDLSQNMLSGDLPLVPASLHHLALSQNTLSGSLERLAYLSRLKYIDLSLNEFTGSIPASLFGPQLTTVFLQRNRLFGSLIMDGMSTSIETIDLSHNNLSGVLPPMLASAKNIYLNNNHLTGIVPLEYVRKLYEGSIHTLYLQHNYLSVFPLAEGARLPTSGSLCIQYNCMKPPVESPCPLSSGSIQRRPIFECDTFNRRS